MGYDVHEGQFGRCMLLLSRSGFPMPLVKEDEVLLVLQLANHFPTAMVGVLEQCWR